MAAAAAHVLPDVLRPGLSVVFCGTAAGHVSAARGAYYAHPHNKFWPTLYAIGLIGRQFRPEDFADAPSFGVGLTDIAKTVKGMDKDLPTGSLGRDPCAAMEAKILAAQPAFLAFTSLTAGGRYLALRRRGEARRALAFGEPPERIGATRLWVLPSPSPAANWNWDDEPWRALAAAVRAARHTRKE